MAEKPAVKQQVEHKEESKKTTPVPKAHTAPQVHHTNGPASHKPATPVPNAHAAAHAERKPSAIEDKAAHHEEEVVQDGVDVNQVEDNQDNLEESNLEEDDNKSEDAGNEE